MLFEFISNCVEVFKLRTKYNLDTINISHDEFSVIITSFAVDFISNAADMKSLRLTGTIHSKSHKNNAIINNDGKINSLFSVPHDDGTVLIRDNGNIHFTRPVFNDNEEEILFTVSTVTSAYVQITLMSILLTLDTHLCTMYSDSIVEDDIPKLNKLIEEAKQWIISNSPT